MANDDHIALLKKGVDAWNAWRKENPNIHPDFREADLSEANLVHADLSHANLFRAHLSDGADLKAGSYGQWFGRYSRGRTSAVWGRTSAVRTSERRASLRRISDGRAWS